MKNILGSSWGGAHYKLIFLLWCILTLININKAYHIDDTFHLEAAKCIQANPLKPMSGYINWANSPTQIYTHNQPPLFFYIISLTRTIFGENEIVMHLLLSIFTMLSLIYFNKLSVFLGVQNKSLLLTLFALSPAFIVNQNLMTDVPILAISLGTMYYLLKGLKDGDFKNYIRAALLLSCGLLIKYSLVPLFFVLLFSILLSKNFKKATVLALPILVILLWSMWNLIEFNSIHIIDRHTSGFDSMKIVSFLGALGSVAFLSVVYIYFYFPNRITRSILLSLFILFIILVPLVYYGIVDEGKFNEVLNAVFISNGSILLALVIVRAIELLVKEKSAYFNTADFPIVLYIGFLSVFIAVFAPFNATRHILLLLPFLLLFGRKLFERSQGLINNLLLISSVTIGLLLGISDWIYADFYRQSAKKINVTDRTVWSIGHWGWQWYSEKSGMKIYSTENDLNVKRGDIIVFPKNVSGQELSSDIQLDTIDFITEAPNFLTFFSGKYRASMYSTFFDKPAWSLSNIAIDTIFICRVKKEIGGK